MTAIRDEFLSEEDLDLRNLTKAELLAVWDAWLLQAQATNEMDAHEYAHGVFASDPPPRLAAPRPMPASPRHADSAATGRAP